MTDFVVVNWVCLVLFVCYCSYQARASDDGYSGHLGHLDLSGSDTYTLEHGDNRYGSLTVSDDILFGDKYYDIVYISTNGYFSLGERPSYDTLPNFPLSSSFAIVAPFAADIDTSTVGSVRFADLSLDLSQKDDVHRFIRQQTRNRFYYATTMIVAEWRTVPLDSGSTATTNTFQGIIISDDEASYAVFIYECGGMEWGGGVIGWQASTSDYESHSLSGESNSDDIGCLYSSTTSAVVYPMSTCPYDQFTCDNGNCVPRDLVCDQHDICGDNSDEEKGCVNVPLIVGVTIAAVVLLGSGGVIACVVCFLVFIRRRHHSVVATHIVSTTPVSAATTVVATNSNYQPAPVVMPVVQTGYPPQYQPQSYSQPKIHPDAAF